MNRLGIMFAVVLSIVGCRQGYTWYGDDADSSTPDAAEAGPDGSDGGNCTQGFHLCSGVCADNHSALSCGSACSACPTAPANATATCDGTTCGFACAAGFVEMGGSCSALSAPRPVAPLSTSTVTSQRPTFRWVLAPGSDGGHVQVCRDRACSSVVQEFNAIGTSGIPSIDLPVGVVFWRMQSRIGTATATGASPTWQMNVGARSAAISSSWGTTVDVNGDGFADVIVGADNVSNSTGRVYVYAGGAAGLNPTPATSLTGPDGPNAQFGLSAASAGDVNGDGFADVIVGAQGGGGNFGRAYIYFGSAAGLNATPATSLTGPDGTGVGFGSSVASAGDVNGDGFADVVIGTYPLSTIPEHAYIYLGSSAGLNTSPATSLTGPDGMNAHFGSSVASAGDVNGDGFGDVIIGAYGANTSTGHAYVYLGSAVGLGASPATSLAGRDGTHGAFGISVAGAGDVNGDGFADVIVGASGAGNIGRAYAYFGSAAGVEGLPTSFLTEPAGVNGDAYGISVATAGDLNRDGFADAIVGADGANTTAGAAYVYFGSAAGLDSSHATSLAGTDGMYGYFGHSTASAGDVNGDGFGDVVVGAFGANSNVGGAYVYPGSLTGLSSTWATSLSGPDGANANFGHSVASATDPLPRPLLHVRAVSLIAGPQKVRSASLLAGAADASASRM